MELTTQERYGWRYAMTRDDILAMGPMMPGDQVVPPPGIGLPRWHRVNVAQHSKVPYPETVTELRRPIDPGEVCEILPYGGTIIEPSDQFTEDGGTTWHDCLHCSGMSIEQWMQGKGTYPLINAFAIRRKRPVQPKPETRCIYCNRPIVFQHESWTTTKGVITTSCSLNMIDGLHEPVQPQPAKNDAGGWVMYKHRKPERDDAPFQAFWRTNAGRSGVSIFQTTPSDWDETYLFWRSLPKDLPPQDKTDEEVEFEKAKQWFKDRHNRYMTDAENYVAIQFFHRGLNAGRDFERRVRDK